MTARDKDVVHGLRFTSKRQSSDQLPAAEAATSLAVGRDD